MYDVCRRARRIAIVELLSQHADEPNPNKEIDDIVTSNIKSIPTSELKHYAFIQHV